jgi:hypothetical protein
MLIVVVAVLMDWVRRQQFNTSFVLGVEAARHALVRVVGVTSGRLDSLEGIEAWCADCVVQLCSRCV